MENASKALLIAAGMLFAILIISLLVILYNQVSSYYAGQNKLTEIEQLEKFNAKFENYHDKQIRGNELVSILNMIVDYNNLQANAEGYEPISVVINLQGHQEELKWRGETGDDTLIPESPEPIRNGTNDETIKRIAGTSSRLSLKLGISDVKLQKLAGRISDIVDEPSNSHEKEEYEEFRKQILEKIFGYDVSDSESIKTATYQYYQYMQFKRAMFDCTSVTYNTDNGRVNGMTFDVIVENDRIKFD